MIGEHWRDLLLLFGLALAVRLLTALPIHQPGYADAAYYASGARQIYRGKGLDEPFIWNYLDPPASIPHPGYQYWMPLPSLLGGLSMWFLDDSFLALQLPFVLLSALLPLVAYTVAWDLTAQRKHALLAGALAIFPGFFGLGFVLPETFAPFALAGSICLWAAGRGLRDRRAESFGLAGLAAGLAHLTRADGILLAGVAFLAAAWLAIARPAPGAGKVGARSMALTVLGYLLVMGPWFVRNWLTFGTPLSNAGTRTMFLTNYDDLFALNTPLTVQNYLTWGIGPILESKWDALLMNLKRVWAEDLMIVLLPFTGLGLWHLRRKRLLWPFFLYATLLFASMTFVFTFPGQRGALYHSSSAWLPFVYAAAGPGLEIMVRWAARRLKGWHAHRAWRVFAVGLVALALCVTLFALGRLGVLNGQINEKGQPYAQIGDWLAERGGGEAVVMVGSPSAFHWYTGHWAIAIPDEPLDTILAVADRYGARYLVLDGSRSRPTDGLYEGRVSHPRLTLRQTIGGDERILLFEVGP